MTRAMDPEVADAIWAAIEPILPIPVDDHPLGCHNPRVPDRVCFRGILIRLVTGSSWVDIEAIMNFEVSDTTLRARRDEWIAAGVFDQLEAEARAGYDRIIELDLDVVAIDGSCTRRPAAAREPAKALLTGPNWAGSGRSRRSARGSRSAGRSTAPTATTSPCSNPPWTPSPPPGCSPTSAPSPSTAATTTRRSEHRLHARGLDRSRHPTPRHQTPARAPAPAHARAALGRRSDQHMVVELRATPPQHRPQDPPPTRRPPTRHRRTHRRPTHRLPQPMEPH